MMGREMGGCRAPGTERLVDDGPQSRQMKGSVCYGSNTVGPVEPTRGRGRNCLEILETMLR